jgi:hypothetical protein
MKQHTRKRLLVGGGLALLVAAALLLVPAWRGAVWGLLSGPPQFQGKSAETWGQILKEENETGVIILLSDRGPTRNPASVIDQFVVDGGSGPIGVLHLLLRHEDDYVRMRAAEGLGRIRSKQPQVVAALAESLTDPSAAVRWEAAEALGRIGRSASAARPGLAERLHDEHELVRICAARALGRLGTPDSVPPLLEALRDPSEYVRWEAVEALAWLGHDARAALPALEAAQQDESRNVRDAADAAIRQIPR